METWLAGLLAGFLATVIMTVVSTYDPHQTTRISAMLLARLLGGDYNAIAMRLLGIASHFAYGSLVGLLAALLAVDVFGIESWLWVWGLCLAAILLVFKLALWHPVSGLRSELATRSEQTRQRVIKLGMPAHALYGASLGGLIEIWLAA